MNIVSDNNSLLCKPKREGGSTECEGREQSEREMPWFHGFSFSGHRVEVRKCYSRLKKFEKAAALIN